jgi:hypothetical protein
VKKAYLVGVANILQIEAAYQGPNPPSDAQSLVPMAAKGLRGHTLGQRPQRGRLVLRGAPGALATSGRRGDLVRGGRAGIGQSRGEVTEAPGARGLAWVG